MNNETAAKLAFIGKALSRFAHDADNKTTPKQEEAIDAMITLIGAAFDSIRRVESGEITNEGKGTSSSEDPPIAKIAAALRAEKERAAVSVSDHVGDVIHDAAGDVEDLASGAKDEPPIEPKEDRPETSSPALADQSARAMLTHEQMELNAQIMAIAELYNSDNSS